MGNTSFQNNKLDIVSSKVSLQLIDMKININDISISIQVYYGNDIYPKLWDIPIIEYRSQSLALPLSIKRFLYGVTPSNFQPFTFIEKHQQIYAQNISLNPLENNSTFYAIRIPSYIINEELPPILIANYSQNTVQQYEQQKYQYSYSKQFRYQYRLIYSKVFQSILKSMKVCKSIGILDLPLNNPLIGINLQNIVQDILDSYFQTLQNVNCQKNSKLIFTSENKQQAYLIATIIQNLITQNSKYYYNQLSQVQQIYLNYTLRNIRNNKLEIKNKQCSQIKSLQKNKKKKLNIYTFHDFITQLFIRKYDQKLEDFEKNIVTLTQSNNLCLCGQQLKNEKVIAICCYCFINGDTFMSCRNDACQRRYCSSCKYIVPKQLKNQEWQIVNNSATINLNCHSCKSKIDIGKHFIRKQFRITLYINICLQCYYLEYIRNIYEKQKVMYQIIIKKHPSLSLQIINEIINEYLCEELQKCL